MEKDRYDGKGDEQQPLNYQGAGMAMEPDESEHAVEGAPLGGNRIGSENGKRRI